MHSCLCVLVHLCLCTCVPVCACICSCVCLLVHVCPMCVHLCACVYVCVFVLLSHVHVCQKQGRTGREIDGSPPSPALLHSQLPLPSQIEQIQLKCIPLCPKSPNLKGSENHWCGRLSWQSTPGWKETFTTGVKTLLHLEQDKANPLWDTCASRGITWEVSGAAPPVPFSSSTFHG